MKRSRVILTDHVRITVHGQHASLRVAVETRTRHLYRLVPVLRRGARRPPQVLFVHLHGRVGPRARRDFRLLVCRTVDRRRRRRFCPTAGRNGFVLARRTVSRRTVHRKRARDRGRARVQMVVQTAPDSECGVKKTPKKKSREREKQKKKKNNGRWFARAARRCHGRPRGRCARARACVV